MAKQQAVIKWSKKEMDYQVHYPDRNGKIIGAAFFNMIGMFEDFMSIDWEGKATDFSTFRNYLYDAGYSPDTLKISIDKRTDIIEPTNPDNQ